MPTSEDHCLASAIQLHPNTSELNFDSTKNNEKTMKVKTLQKQFHDVFNYDGVC